MRTSAKVTDPWVHERESDKKKTNKKTSEIRRFTKEKEAVIRQLTNKKQQPKSQLVSQVFFFFLVNKLNRNLPRVIHMHLQFQS